MAARRVRGCSSGVNFRAAGGAPPAACAPSVNPHTEEDAVMVHLTDTELRQRLCERDPRHPLHATRFAGRDAGPVNAADCGCEGCVIGLHRLADAVIACRAEAEAAPSLWNLPA